MTVPLHCANGVFPPSGQVKTSVPLSVVKTTIVLSSTPMSLSFFMHDADVVVELGHAGFLDATSHSSSCASSRTSPRGA